MSLTVKEKINVLIKLLREPKVFTKLISFRSFGYLVDTGWFNSFKSGESVNAEFDPIPWFTYPAVDFLHGRLKNNLRVLEFGSGNSTLFLASQVKQVISMEHNKEWYQKLKPKIAKNTELIFTSCETAVDYLKPFSGLGNFDIIVVDGLFRNQCIIESVNHLSQDGVIILDDSERNGYNQGIILLRKVGFKQLDFSGISAGIFFKKCTSIFYKDKNCLDI